MGWSTVDTVCLLIMILLLLGPTILACFEVRSVVRRWMDNDQ